MPTTVSSTKKEITWGLQKFNKFLSATCEHSSNKCSAGRLHKCSECHKWGCKATRHTEQRMQSLATCLPTSNEPAAEKTTTENQENVVLAYQLLQTLLENSKNVTSFGHLLSLLGRNFHYLLTVVAQFLLSVALMLIMLLPNVHT